MKQLSCKLNSEKILKDFNTGESFVFARPIMVDEQGNFKTLPNLKVPVSALEGEVPVRNASIMIGADGFSEEGLGNAKYLKASNLKVLAYQAPRQKFENSYDEDALASLINGDEKAPF